MHPLSLKKHRRKDDALHDASAVWEVRQIPGLQLAREFRSTSGPHRMAWRIFLSPGLATRRHTGLVKSESLSSIEEAAVKIAYAFRNQAFPTRHEALQALEVEVFQRGIDLKAAAG